MADQKRDGLTHEEIVVACRNIGWDMTCGQCASVFYTGSGTYAHDATCTTVGAREVKVQFSADPLAGQDDCA